MPTAKIPIKALPIDKPYAWETDGLKIVLVRTAEGVYAFHDVCPHASWPLSAGTFHDGKLECPGHGWEFRVETGECPDSPTYCLTRVSASMDGQMVRLEWETESVSQETEQRCSQMHERALQARDPRTEPQRSR